MKHRFFCVIPCESVACFLACGRGAVASFRACNRKDFVQNVGLPFALQIKTMLFPKKISPEMEECLRRFGEFAAGQPDIVCAYLFGSRARGGAGELSDLDIGVHLDPACLSEGDLARRKLDLLCQMLEYFAVDEMDLVLLNDCPPALAYEVIAPGRILYSRDEARRAELETHILETYFDLLPMWERYDRAFKQRILEGRMCERVR
jgi:predicted nucleotidyltransferase